MFSFRFGQPQSSFLLEPWYDTELKLAEKLFGEENVQQTLRNKKAPIPVPLFCRDSKLQLTQGKNISGASARFCNEFQPILTDVGVCMAKDSVYKINPDDVKVNNQTVAKLPISQALRFAETTIVISNGNWYGSTDSFEDPFMTILPRIAKHSNHDKIQMQIQQNIDLPKILFGSNQRDEHKSIQPSPRKTKGMARNLPSLQFPPQPQPQPLLKNIRSMLPARLLKQRPNLNLSRKTILRTKLKLTRSLIATLQATISKWKEARLNYEDKKS